MTLRIYIKIQKYYCMLMIQCYIKKISDSHRFLDMHDFQQDVNRLISWFQLNRLSINVKKTELVFYPHSQTVDNNINNEMCISIIPVDYVTSYLYLGVDIDNILSFRP